MVAWSLGSTWVHQSKTRRINSWKTARVSFSHWFAMLDGTTQLQGRYGRGCAAGIAHRGGAVGTAQEGGAAGTALQGWCCRDGTAGVVLQGRHKRVVLQGRHCRGGAAEKNC